MSLADDFRKDAGITTSSAVQKPLSMADQFKADAGMTGPNTADAYHVRMRAQQALDAIPRDVTQDMSGMQKFMAGAGKAVYDTGRGIGNIVTDIAPGAAQYGFSTRADTDKSKKVDANLMNTGAGLAGNIAGGAAIAAPLAFATGGASVLGGAAIGAGTAAIQPVGTDESRMQNMAVGGALGGALPAALRAGKVAKAALVDPFTQNGRQRIVGGAIRAAAADPAEAGANMAMARGATPGFNPTAGQASNDAGVASLERAARAIDPAGFGDIDTSQRSALINALRSVAQTPEDRAAAVAARDGAAETLYGTARTSDTMRRELAQNEGVQAASLKYARSGGMSAPPNDAAAAAAAIQPSAELSALMKRPDFQSAVGQARALAANKGVDLGDPLTSIQGMHYVKLALDDMIQPSGASALGNNARGALTDMRGTLLDEMSAVSPAYGTARNVYADMSKPINQMDIGQELYNRFVPPLADGAAVPFRSTADAYAKALTRNGDKLAANVTGMKNARLESIMEPGQMDLLRGVVSDSQMKAAAENIGRGVGSDTVQKMAMSHVIDQAGLPSWIGALAPLRSVGGMAKTVGDIVYTKNDETMRHLLADVLKDPTRAADAMNRAGVPPSKYAEVLKKLGVAGAVGTANTANNQQQN